MTAQPYATLTLTGDPDGDGQTETGTFTFVGNLEVTPGLRTGWIAGGRDSPINSLLANAIQPGEALNKQLYLDAGAGAFTIEISFRSWEGAVYEDRETGDRIPAQWGDTGNTGAATMTDATGAPPTVQICVLMQYLLTGTTDSRDPATLEWGEWSTDGLYEPLDVVLEGPQMTRAAEDGSWFDGSLTCVIAADVRNALDAVENNTR